MSPLPLLRRSTYSVSCITAQPHLLRLRRCRLATVQCSSSQHPYTKYGYRFVHESTVCFISYRWSLEVLAMVRIYASTCCVCYVGCCVLRIHITSASSSQTRHVQQPALQKSAYCCKYVRTYVLLVRSLNFQLHPASSSNNRNANVLTRRNTLVTASGIVFWSVWRGLASTSLFAHDVLHPCGRKTSFMTSRLSNCLK